MLAQHTVAPSKVGSPLGKVGRWDDLQRQRPVVQVEPLPFVLVEVVGGQRSDVVDRDSLPQRGRQG